VFIAERTVAVEGAWRDRAGFCGVDVPHLPSGVLDVGQRATLLRITERCKLTHDLMAFCTDRYAVFPARVAVEQTRTLVAGRTLLDRYGLIDPHVGLGPGGFATPQARHDFAQLTRLAGTGRAAALAAVDRLLRETIDALERELRCRTAADVRDFYLHLSATTHRQLRLMQAWSGR
jgi:hypothetical protein